MTAPGVRAATRHREFDHIAVFHDGARGLVDAMVGDVAPRIRHDDAVLVCLADAVWADLRRSLGPTVGGWHYVPDTARYAGPRDAMRALHDFVTASLRDGAGRVWSIGAIPFGAAADDAAWLRYEAAVNDVLAHHPLVAACIYDTSVLPAPLVAHARRCHGPEAGAALDGAGSGIAAPVPPGDEPTGEPALRCTVSSPAMARAAVCDVLAEEPGEHLAAAQLVVSELATNALSYGTPPVTLTVWHRRGGPTVLEVEDHGAGIQDPFFDLRPPRRVAGGAGLWIVGQTCERVTSSRVGERHRMTVTIRGAAAPA